jgi:membrane protein required for colicin V production
MFLTIFDLILILIIFLFTAWGFITGLIQAVGKIIGLILGVWFAGLYFSEFGIWLNQYIPGDERVAKVIGFIIIFVTVSQITGLIFLLLEKIFHLISIIPFLKTFNRLLGAIFGLVEGVLILSLTLFVIDKFFTTGWLHQVITGSQVAFWLLMVAKIFVPLLPEVLKKAKTII